MHVCAFIDFISKYLRRNRCTVNKWYKLKAKEINTKMKFNDNNPPSSNMNANNKSNDKVQSAGVNDGEKIKNVNDAL